MTKYQQKIHKLVLAPVMFIINCNQWLFIYSYCRCICLKQSCSSIACCVLMILLILLLLAPIKSSLFIWSALTYMQFHPRFRRKLYLKDLSINMTCNHVFRTHYLTCFYLTVVIAFVQEFLLNFLLQLLNQTRPNV